MRHAIVIADPAATTTREVAFWILAIIAVTAGLGVRLPLVSVIKFVMVTVPPDGIVNEDAKTGVWANEVTFVAGPPPTPGTKVSDGLMDTPTPYALAVQDMVVVAEFDPTKLPPIPI